VIIEPIPSPSFHEQSCRIGKHEWSVPRLVQLSSDLQVFDLPIAHMNLYAELGTYTLREFAGHVKAVINADMTKPIIIDEDGEIMDGRHRVMRAILEGIHSVKAVRFLENPTPCRVNEE